MTSLLGARVLVTGSTGMIGRALVRRLEREGATVVPLARRAEGPGALAVDIASYESLQHAIAGHTFDIVYHLASAGVNPAEERGISLLRVNAEGTENLLRALERVPPCPVVVAGSWTEYGASRTGVMSENDVCTPRSPYGISKLASTLSSLAWAARTSRPLTVLRLFSVYGPGEGAHRLGPSVFRALREGRPPTVAEPGLKRDFVYIDDVIDAFLRAADLREQGLILNVGTGQAESISDFIRAMQSALGTTIEPKWGSNPPRPWDVPATCADVTRLQKVFAWVPKTRPTEVMPRLIDAYSTPL